MQRKKRPKNSKKRPKNSTIKPLFTVFVPCIKIQGCHAPPHPLAPAADVYDCTVSSQLLVTIFEVNSSRTSMEEEGGSRKHITLYSAFKNTFLSRNLDRNMPKTAEKMENRRSVGALSLQTPIGTRRSGDQTFVLLLLPIALPSAFLAFNVFTSKNTQKQQTAKVINCKRFTISLFT